jgi:hypothetical protein
METMGGFYKDGHDLSFSKQREYGLNIWVTTANQIIL